MNNTLSSPHMREILFGIVVLAVSVGVYLALNNSGEEQFTACTEDAYVCPDGSAVGRVGPLCEFAPCPSGEPQGGNAVLGIGETKTLGGMTITFHGVKADYRCPSDAQCIEAGAIVADVTFNDGVRAERFNMPSDEAPRVFGTYQVSIQTIEPPLISTEKTDPRAYRVTFLVESLTDTQLVETRVRERIHDLSPVREVLGGTFYVTDITFGAPGTAVVAYEDGHIALVADITYTISETREVTITNFTVRDDTPADTTPAASQPLLDLSGQGLTTVSKDVFSRTNLVSLDLSDNKLTGALPAEVRHLGKLTWLDLSHNGFTGVPAEIGQLSQLRYLNLSHNNITGLPYELGNLKNLEILDLTGNNYAKADLAVIKQKLPDTVRILGE